MTNPQRPLTAEEIAQEGLRDWHLTTTGLEARFATGDFAVGLALVVHIGATAEEANHHPDITLTYPEVHVTLVSHDVGGVTGRDIDLARHISQLAAEAGVTVLWS